jgi:hypothetical protein
MRKEEEKRGGLAGPLILGCMAVFIGIAVAAAQLALRPVSMTPKKASDPKTTVACVMGSDCTSTKGYDDRAKAVMHGKSGNYVFTEGDINALIMKHFSPIVAIDGIEVARIVELPNVRFMDDGKVQVAVVLSFPDWFDKRLFVYQVHGRIVPGGYKPDMGWIGQCPVPFFNEYFLQCIRSRLVLDKGVKNLDKIREIASFSRDGNELFVSVEDTKKSK